MDILFSIIIPTYNRSGSILKTLDSVKAQFFKNWECIVIDDGSTDNTKKLVENYIIHDKRFKYIYQENAERCVARNHGIKLGKGEYICFLDSDDRFLKNHLQDFYQYITENNEPKALIISNTIKKIGMESIPSQIDNIADYENNVCFVLISKESIIPSRVCVHQEILRNHKFNENIYIAEDTELFCRIAAEYQVVLLKSHSVVYNIHDGNSVNLSKNPFVGQLASLKIIFSNKKLKNKISNKVKNQKLSYCYFGIARYHELEKNYFKKVYYILHSMIYSLNDKLLKRKMYMIAEPILKTLKYK